jgi:hypothetical protein
MNVKFPALSDGQKGSCSGLVNYLEKENVLRAKNKLSEEHFFSHNRHTVPVSEVIKTIDSNTKKLGKEDYKFYTFSINPSKTELAHIGQDAERLRAYTRQIMEEYAKNFHRGLTAKDLVYFAKVEYERKDRQTGADKGEGNMHIHILVSRRDKEQRYKLSPYSNARGEYETQNKIKSGGFNRNTFRESSERVFDTSFSYKRSFTETFSYQNSMKNGDFTQKQAAISQLNEQRREKEKKEKQVITQQKEKEKQSQQKQEQEKQQIKLETKQTQKRGWKPKH